MLIEDHLSALLMDYNLDNLTQAFASACTVSNLLQPSVSYSICRELFVPYRGPFHLHGHVVDPEADYAGA